MSAAYADLESREALREQLLKDQTNVIERVTGLANTIAPDHTWAENLFPESACFETDGQIKGYKTSFKLRLRAEIVGHDIDDVTAIDIARRWFAEQDYEVIRDHQLKDGMREVWAVQERDNDGIGMAVSAHPGLVAVQGTTKCRR